MYGAYFDNRLIGVLAVSDRNYVSCVFVDKQYHRKGVASAMLHAIISEFKKKGQKKVLLNATPYALPFYHKLGFVDTDIERDYKGIRYTTMELPI
jgi:GNAT superfamily N-acetyltransferase